MQFGRWLVYADHTAALNGGFAEDKREKSIFYDGNEGQNPFCEFADVYEL